MKLSVKGLALASGIIWALAVVVVGLANLWFPPYGDAFIELMKSLYPGYRDMTGLGGVLVATVYALVDGAICGAVFAWIYNVFAGGAGDAGREAAGEMRAAA